jgi:type II secretory pathway component PulJ
MQLHRGTRGFTLMELLIGVFLSTIMISGVLQLVSASASAYRLQLELSGVEASGRYARDVLARHVSEAGYHPEPWRLEGQMAALSGEALDNVSTKGDQLGLQRFSRQNCYGNDNPDTDDAGRPAFYLLQSRFHVNADNNLAMTCRYGPDASSLVTQVNSFWLVENFENLQVLYAEDQNGDDVADRWVSAASWENERHVKALKIALLLATHQPVGQAAEQTFNLLEEDYRPPADGRIRRVVTSTCAIRGRSSLAGTTP